MHMTLYEHLAHTGTERLSCLIQQGLSLGSLWVWVWVSVGEGLLVIDRSIPANFDQFLRLDDSPEFFEDFKKKVHANW